MKESNLGALARHVAAAVGSREETVRVAAFIEVQVLPGVDVLVGVDRPPVVAICCAHPHEVVGRYGVARPRGEIGKSFESLPVVFPVVFVSVSDGQRCVDSLFNVHRRDLARSC